MKEARPSLKDELREFDWRTSLCPLLLVCVSVCTHFYDSLGTISGLNIDVMGIGEGPNAAKRKY